MPSRSSIFLFGLFLSLANYAFAQNFVPIGNGYDCMTLGNGDQFLVIRKNTSYQLVNSLDVSKSLVKERRLINNRLATIREISANFKESKPDFSALKKFKNIWKLSNGSAIDGSLIDSQSERRQALANLKALLKTRKGEIAIFLDRINACDAGQVQVPKGGDLIYPSIKVIGLVGSLEVYSGWMIQNVALPNKFNPKPGGYAGCLKFYWKNGATNTYFSGLSTEPCTTGIGGLNRFEFATNECNAELDSGQVGFAQQHGYSISKDPAVLQLLVDSAHANTPEVVFLRMPIEMASAPFRKICEDWNK